MKGPSSWNGDLQSHINARLLHETRFRMLVIVVSHPLCFVLIWFRSFLPPDAVPSLLIFLGGSSSITALSSLVLYLLGQHSCSGAANDLEIVRDSDQKMMLALAVSVL